MEVNDKFPSAAFDIDEAGKCLAIGRSTAAVFHLMRALETAIRAVHQGKAFFSPEISKMLAEDYMRQMRQRGVEDSYELLTPREREILQMLGEGNSNKDVATKLNLSLHTVETHRGNVLEKLNLHNTAEMILYAVRKGIVAS